MSGFLSILFLVTFGLLIWSQINPSKFSKRFDRNDKHNLARKHFGMGFGMLALILLIMIGAASPQPPSKTVKLTTAKSSSSTSDHHITSKSVSEIKSIPFTSTTEQDSSLTKGTTKVTTAGINGNETLTYKITYDNDQQTNKQLVSDVVTSKPLAQVTSVGTSVAPPSTSCYPLTNSGNCYKPGEYCRNSDHGASGVAGNGESITCTYNNGWRWEP